MVKILFIRMTYKDGQWVRIVLFPSPFSVAYFASICLLNDDDDDDDRMAWIPVIHRVPMNKRVIHVRVLILSQCTFLFITLSF